MNREDVKKAADAIGRLEALDAAWLALGEIPHDALPVSFPGTRDDGEGEAEPGIDMHVIQVFYPRSDYRELLAELVRAARDCGANWFLFSGLDPVRSFLQDPRWKEASELHSDPPLSFTS